MAVLLGYAVALGGTSSGHGLRLAVHLLTEHHDEERHDEAPHGDGRGHDASAWQEPPARAPIAADDAPLASESSRRSEALRLSPSSRGTVRACNAGVSDCLELRTHERGGLHDEAHHDEAHDDHGGAEEGPHSHQGHVHSHREAPPAPALVSVELDKHCVFAGPLVVAPGDARRLDWSDRAATPAPVVLSVEVRPPQRAA